VFDPIIVRGVFGEGRIPAANHQAGFQALPHLTDVPLDGLSHDGIGGGRGCNVTAIRQGQSADDLVMVIEKGVNGLPGLDRHAPTGGLRACTGGETRGHEGGGDLDYFPGVH
jgi:hypothetical protein